MEKRHECRGAELHVAEPERDPQQNPDRASQLQMNLEDFELSQARQLPVLVPIDGEGRYLAGYGSAHRPSGHRRG